VTNAEADAKCIGVTPSAASATCVCGCASCAGTCDGQGPIVGAGQTLRFDFPTSNLPTGARVGVMVRLRGNGSVEMSALPKDGQRIPIGQITAPSEFSEILAGTGTGPPGFRPEANRQPVALQLETQGNVEVDCVVPYVAP
jgi:hypothetical protein